MHRLTLLLILSSFFAIMSCQSGSRQTQKYRKLEPNLVSEIEILQKGSWIVIADQAFPLHSRRGVRTLIVDQKAPEILNGVIKSLAKRENLSPIFHTTKELTFVENDAAPGINYYRNKIDHLLQGHELRQYLSAHLSVLLSDNSKTAPVLVIKTKTDYPYSAIYIELEGPSSLPSAL